MQPLRGLLVVDLTLQLPGPFASRELLRLGARVVRLEPPGGDPTRTAVPGWDAALNAGKESVECDLKTAGGRSLAQALCARADVVLEGFRPGVAGRLGVGGNDVPDRVVYCSITGFGSGTAHEQRVAHDLNYLGWAGLLADTAPALPPVPIADLAGAQRAVVEILAALLARAQTGRGPRIEISLTHAAHRLAAHRLDGEPTSRLLTGGLAGYRVYSTADGRHLTVAALESRFFERLCELIGRPDLASHRQAPEQEELAAELEAVFSSRPLEAWLDLFEGEEVAVGPVWTLEEAAAGFGEEARGQRPPTPGEHTAAWRADLGAGLDR